MLIDRLSLCFCYELTMRGRLGNNSYLLSHLLSYSLTNTTIVTHTYYHTLSHLLTNSLTNTTIVTRCKRETCCKLENTCKRESHCKLKNTCKFTQNTTEVHQATRGSRPLGQGVDYGRSTIVTKEKKVKRYVVLSVFFKHLAIIFYHIIEEQQSYVANVSVL